MSRRIKIGAGVAAVVVAGAAATGFWFLRRSVRRALGEPASQRRALQFVALPAPSDSVASWGSGDVVGVVAMPTGPIWAGGSGAFEGDRFLSGLPTLSVSAITSWRGIPVVGLTSGGVYRRLGGQWEEARSGWGALHVRALAETEAGELLVGAREGLFRAAVGAASLERLDERPVRCLALGKGFVLAGGEDGLRRVEAGRAVALSTPDAWVESVALTDETVVVVTATGLARGPLGGTLVPVAGGEEVVAGVLHEGKFHGIDGTSPALLRLDASGSVSEEVLPEAPRRLLSSKSSLFADTDSGLYARGALGWKLVRPRQPSLPGSAHVSALAWMGSHLVAGLFDGGLAMADEKEGRLAWRAVPGTAAWGVNALLPAGGVLYVASLRGAARFDGATLRPLDGPGAAFALAATRDGVAIGYGQGVLLPGPRLLSAFHGLPGNQVLALAPDSASGLFAGTPWGLAAVEGGRVRWRVGLGEGALPHPWITALALDQDTLYVGTYGGGVTRRAASRPLEPGRFEPFPETERLKVSAGCLLVAGGRLYVGTEGSGVFRLSRDRKRFEPVRLALPSPRVTALLASDGALYVGTDEGLARVPIDTDSPPTRQMASILETTR